MSFSQSFHEEKHPEPPKKNLMTDAQQIDHLCEWIKQELEKISGKYKALHDSHLFSKKKYKTNIKTLLDQVTAYTANIADIGPAEKLKKIINIVNNELIDLIKKHSLKVKKITADETVNAFHYVIYNDHLESREEKSKSHYPRMLSHLLLNIKKLAEDDNICNVIRGIISANIESDIKKMGKNPCNNYELNTFGQYLSRVLACEAEQKVLLGLSS